MEQTTLDSGTVLTHHDWQICGGEPCPLHNPTDHEFRQYPMDWDSSWGVMVRRVPIPGGVETVIDPDEYRLRGPKYILENSAKCLECGDHIISMSRHDFETCSCGNISVDGGHDYQRRVFGEGRWEDTSLYIGGNE